MGKNYIIAHSHFTIYFLDCQEYHEHGYRENGIYTLKFDNSTVINAFCTFSDVHGFTVISNRNNVSGGAINFNQNWDEYKYGFGDLMTEHWLGMYVVRIATNYLS